MAPTPSNPVYWSLARKELSWIDFLYCRTISATGSVCVLDGRKSVFSSFNDSFYVNLLLTDSHPNTLRNTVYSSPILIFRSKSSLENLYQSIPTPMSLQTSKNNFL